MKITILKNKINNLPALEKGIIIATQKCASIGFTLDVTYKEIDKNFDSISISSDVVTTGYAIRPEEILAFSTGEDIVLLVSPYAKVCPNNFSTNKPINPCTWDLDKTTLKNTIVMEICEEWYAGFDWVFASYLLHELCHAMYDKTGILPDLTHSQYMNSNYSQKQPDDYYLFLLKDLTTKIMPTYKYFKDSEIVGLKPELVSLLDQARDIASIPFKITSGYRTPSQNALVGGVQDSAHETGLAVDLLVADSVSGGKILLALAQVGFKRFGFYNDGHIHCDIDTTKPSPCYWIK